MSILAVVRGDVRIKNNFVTKSVLSEKKRIGLLCPKNVARLLCRFGLPRVCYIYIFTGTKMTLTAIYSVGLAFVGLSRSIYFPRQASVPLTLIGQSER